MLYSRTSPPGSTSRHDISAKYYPQQRERQEKRCRRQKRRGEEEERVVSTTLSLLLAFTWPFSSLTKQPGWSSSSESWRPPLQLRNRRALRASCLSGWRPGRFTPRRHSGSDAGGGEGGGGGGGGGEGRRRNAQERRTEGRLAGEKAKGETLNTPELGLIYFINRDYKFNLQTRGQNFSLTRGPWRTSGLGDHSYYWLHISICLWCSMSAFLPPLSPSYFLAARLILIVAIEQSIVCL